METRGWIFEDYQFEDLYDVSLSIKFEYQGKIYRLSCEDDQALYDEENGEKIWSFATKEEFYGGVVFGKNINEIINESRIISLF